MKRKRWIFGILLVFVLTIVPAWGIVGEESANGEKLVAITFDDGPGPYTEGLLDALKERNAKATFFLVGSRVSGNTQAVLREYQEGHQVASHSWSHPKLTTLGGDALAAQLNDTAAAISAITGTSEFYLRPPYGSYNDTVCSYAGVPIILWSVDTLDWKYRNVETVKNNIVSGACDGAIILLHDIHETSVQGAIAAIDVLQAEGYKFVTVKELFAAKGIDPQPGKVYSSAKSASSATGDSSQTPAPPQIDDGADFDETKLDTHWAYEDITFVKDRNIFQGTSDTAFSPDKYMTRAMFVTVLSRLYGGDISGSSQSFEDVPAGAYYEEGVAWAVANGIASGTTDTAFSPDEFLTREELAAMLSNLGEYAGVTFPPVYEKENFSDDDTISDYAKDAVYELQQCGILQGMEDGTFAPQGKTTRAQVAKICHSYITHFVDNPPIVAEIKKAFSSFSLPAFTVNTD